MDFVDAIVCLSLLGDFQGYWYSSGWMVSMLCLRNEIAGGIMFSGRLSVRSMAEASFSTARSLTSF